MIGRTNAGGGGGSIDKSQIFVTAPTGSKVTCSNNLIYKSANEKEGQWRFTNLDLGEWTITADKEDRHKEDKISIERLSIIYHNLEYFDAKILVTTEEGATCTCTNGVITLQAEMLSSTLYGFSIPEPGVWTVTAEKNGEKVQSQVDITTDKQNESVTLNFIFYLYQVGGPAPTIDCYRIGETGNINSENWWKVTKNGIDFVGYSNMGNEIFVFSSPIINREKAKKIVITIKANYKTNISFSLSTKSNILNSFNNEPDQSYLINIGRAIVEDSDINKDKTVFFNLGSIKKNARFLAFKKSSYSYGGNLWIKEIGYQ